MWWINFHCRKQRGNSLQNGDSGVIWSWSCPREAKLVVFDSKVNITCRHRCKDIYILVYIYIYIDLRWANTYLRAGHHRKKGCSENQQSSAEGCVVGTMATHVLWSSLDWGMQPVKEARYGDLKPCNLMPRGTSISLVVLHRLHPTPSPKHNIRVAGCFKPLQSDQNS